MSKYNNKKVQEDGFTFDSKAVRQRYLELKLLQRAGQIKNLTLQPRYELQASFKHNGKTHRKIEYVADFQYIDTDTGKTIVEDVKGMKTDVFKLKMKLFLYHYGKQYDFELVR